MRNPDVYSTHTERPRRDLAATLSRFLPRMSWHEPCDVLDVGCSDGKTTSLVLKPSLPSCRWLMGVDMSENMIKVAACHHEDIVFKQLDIGAPNITNFPYTFHKVFSSYCIHWVPDQRRAMKNIMQLLKPGGETLLLIVSRSQLFTMYERMEANPKWAPYMQDVAKVSTPYQHEERPAEVLRSIMIDVGFDVHDCEHQKLNFTHKSISELKDLLASRNPFQVPADLLDQYLEECVTQMVSLGTQHEDGSITTYYELLTVFASKPKI